MPNELTKQIIMGTVRHLMGYVSGAALAAGIGTQDLWMAVTAGVAAIIIIGFSWINKSKNEKRVKVAYEVDPKAEFYSA